VVLRWIMGDAVGASIPNCRLTINGTAAKRTRVRSTGATLAGGWLKVAGGPSGRFNFHYADVTDLWNSATGYCINTNGPNAGTAHVLEKCTFTGCGTVWFNGLASTESLTIDGVTIKTPRAVNNRALELYNLTTISGTPTRIIRNLVIEDGIWRLTGAVSGTMQLSGFTVENVFLRSASVKKCIDSAGSLSVGVATADRVLLYQRGTSCGMPGGTWTRFFVMSEYAVSTQNADSIRIAGPVNLTLDGAIWQGWNSPVGDTLNHDEAVPTTAETYVIKNVLCLPNANAAGGMKGVFGVIGGDHALNNITVEHCTWREAVAGPAALAFVEAATAGYVEEFQSVQSNLCDSSVSRDYKLCAQNTGAAASPTFKTVGHNAYRNLSGLTGLPYRDPQTLYTTPPGTGDVVGQDPMFAFPSRDFLTWGQSIDPAITSWPDLWARFVKLNDADYDPRFNLTDAYTWIREGSRPTNEALRGAAHDGGDIGAVPMTAAVAATASISPANGTQGTAPAVTITGTGTHFSGSTAVSISGAGVSVSALSVANAASLSCTFTIAAGATTGLRTVTVTTGAEVVTTTFTVTIVPPIEPPSGGSGDVGGGAAKQRKGYARMPAPHGRGKFGNPLSGRPVGGGGRRGR